MSVGQGDLFRIERIVSPPTLHSIERDTDHADAQGRGRHRQDADDTAQEETPHDSVEWSEAIRDEVAAAVAIPPEFVSAPLVSLPEAHHLDLTV